MRYREITHEVPAWSTPDSQAAGDLRPTRGGRLCCECEVVVSFSVYFKRAIFNGDLADSGSLTRLHCPRRNLYAPGMQRAKRTVFAGIAGRRCFLFIFHPAVYIAGRVALCHVFALVI